MTQEQHKEQVKQDINNFNFDTANGFSVDEYGSTEEELKVSELYAIAEMSKDKIEAIINAYKYGFMRAAGKATDNN